MPKTASNGATGPANLNNVGRQAIDIEQLAAKVYQLLLEDARLARARGAVQRVRK
jgi:hypothetical protein